MRNDQVKTGDILHKAFNELDLRGKGFHFYTTLLAKAMISEVCMDAVRPLDPPTEFYYQDRAQYYAEILDFWHHMEKIAEHEKAEQQHAWRTVDAQYGE